MMIYENYLLDSPFPLVVDSKAVNFRSILLEEDAKYVKERDIQK